MKKTLLYLMCLAAPVAAQNPLTLEQAVRQALGRHPSLEVATERLAAAGERVRQARAGYFPQVNFTESAASSNNPVFAFSSLLMQRRFSEANFQIHALNHPGFLENYSSQLVLDQMVYDFGRLKSQLGGAETGRQITAEEHRRAEMAVISSVVRTYFGAVLARESLAVAREAVRAAEADQRRAESMRAAGMATDADVLSAAVHLSAMREQEIRRSYDLRVALAALNETLGLPLETQHELATPLSPAAISAPSAAPYEQRALEDRPELRQTALNVRLASLQWNGARAERLPVIGVRAAFEVNRGAYFQNGASNWTFAAQLKWNIFDGFGKQARAAEAQRLEAGARAFDRQMRQAVRVEVLKAWSDLRSAEERISVASAAVEMAEESLRITRNRYENGLATMTDVLRNNTALLEAKTRRLAAVHDQRIAAAALELAAGVLSGDSDVLK